MDLDLMQLSGMGWFSKTLEAAARLQVADELGDSTMTYQEIAERVGADADALQAILRSLSALGVFAHLGDGKFANSPLSHRLRDDHPQSMRHYVILAAGLYTDTFGNVLHTARTGGSAFRALHGTNIYGYLEKHPEDADLYDNAMEDLTRPVSAELARTYDFSAVRSVIDLGGGRGALLKGLLLAHPHLTGIVGERADTCARAAADLRRIGSTDLLERLSYVETDILSKVPGGYDLYTLKNVLHNWNPESSVRILRNIRAALTGTAEQPGGRAPRLLVIEPLIEQEADWMRALFQMTVSQDGTEGRTEEGQIAQLEEAGLTVERVIRLATGHSVFESLPTTSER
ncbi:acetylserotonin O-methyltransferase [Streptomyces halobius]|uniref:Acetylserotonin O-methyltransferase n=1 Tax=Streptomyces halobius TaxID=2879846 RepID=A0ABY4ML49_9ACTN|nr:acetylserotonin O-methyltransferase [Streptomyces halobius]UQA97424.1 acetylserotonin O-methyltransferase [Streptomyces halobius]